MLAFHVTKLIIKLLLNSLAYYYLCTFVSYCNNKEVTMKKWLKKLAKFFRKKSFALALILSDKQDLIGMRNQLRTCLNRVEAQISVRIIEEGENNVS